MGNAGIESEGAVSRDLGGRRVPALRAILYTAPWARYIMIRAVAPQGTGYLGWQRPVGLAYTATTRTA